MSKEERIEFLLEIEESESENEDEDEDEDEEKGKESEHFCDVHEEEPILHDGNGGFMCQVCDDECKEE